MAEVKQHRYRPGLDDPRTTFETYRVEVLTDVDKFEMVANGYFEVKRRRVSAYNAAVKRLDECTRADPQGVYRLTCEKHTKEEVMMWDEY
jgi:hypothetical protein